MSERSDLEKTYVMFSPPEGTLEWKLINSFKQECDREKKPFKTLILEILTIWRLPIALAESGEYSEEEMAQFWLRSIYALEAQKKYMLLRSELKIDFPEQSNFLSAEIEQRTNGNGQSPQDEERSKLDYPEVSGF